MGKSKIGFMIQDHADFVAQRNDDLKTDYLPWLGAKIKNGPSLFFLFEELLADDSIEKEFASAALDEPFLALMAEKKGRPNQSS